MGRRHSDSTGITAGGIAEVNAPIRNVPREGELLGTVRTLEDAVDVFRTMKDRLGLTNQFLEDCYGFAKGHPDKVLGRSEQKRLGYDTFRLFCEVFAVEFRVYVDPAQIKRMEAIWEERERPAYKPDAKPGRIAKKILKAAKPIIFEETGRLGGMVTKGSVHRQPGSLVVTFGHAGTVGRAAGRVCGPGAPIAKRGNDDTPRTDC